MAGLKVFVSSTCYDLSVVREQLRIFIQSLGHEPIMSDYNDVLYDPREHTHSSCVNEVDSCDVVLLIVGQRFGGKTVPEAIDKVDFGGLVNDSKSSDILSKKENLSITQMEILKAVELGLPVFTFIDSCVWHDHATYEKNKDNKKIISKIKFSSIQKPQTAVYIFEFINFLRHRTKNNSVFPFSKVQEIEETLKKQWSSLFQRLLQEQKNRTSERKRIDNLSEQFDNLQAAILSSIGDSNEKVLARGVVRYRKLIDLLRALKVDDKKYIKGQGRKQQWSKILESADIKDTIDSVSHFGSNRILGQKPVVFLVKNDGTYYELRLSMESFEGLANDWSDFIDLPKETRGLIYDTVSEIGVTFVQIKYFGDQFDYSTIKRRSSDFEEWWTLPQEITKKLMINKEEEKEIA